MSTTLTPELALVINGDLPGGANALLKSKTSSDPASERVRWMNCDAWPVRLYWRKPTAAMGAASTVYELTAGYTIALSGKLESDLDDGDALFQITSWAKVGTGDAAYYEGVLDLNVAAIETAFTAAGKNEINVAVDVELETAGNARRVTYRCLIILCQQTYNNEGQPVAGDPLWSSVQPGSSNLVQGSDSVVVSGLALPAVPIGVIVTIHKPASSGDNLFGTVLADSITADGFTVHLSAPAPAAGYKLHYLVIKEVA